MNEGVYKAVVVRTTLGTSSQKGTPYFGVVAQCQGEELPEAKVWMSPRALPRARAVLAKLGFDYSTKSIELLGENPSPLRGTEVEIHVYEDGKYGMKADVITETTFDKATIVSIDSKLREEADDNIPF
jgi:hypothetical protein